MTKILYIRIIDNVLEDECHLFASIAFDKTGHITAICVENKGVYQLPDCIGWSYAQLTEWQNHDPTGEHPEVYYQIKHPDGDRWHFLLKEQEVKSLAHCNCSKYMLWPAYNESCFRCKPPVVHAACDRCGIVHDRDRECRQCDIDINTLAIMGSHRNQL